PKSWLLLAGRILLGLIFVLSGTMKIANWSQTADSMAEHGMVAVPLFLAGAIAFEVGGGLLIWLGWQTRYAAAALFLFLIPVTLVYHDFWSVGGKAMENQMQHFLKNVTIMGGLLSLAAAGAGRFSLDAWAANRQRREQARHEAEHVAEEW